ncbi:hypothetical protein [Mucilaginibacter sp.]|uniref:hypothetical protein n=1 Tax=Mucilaginibacter sp. TaxID=1882438 RepID=UPI0035BC702F
MSRKATWMDASINFYELKTQLADLGFHDPTVVDQLRRIIIGNHQGYPNIKQTKSADSGQADFTLFFDRNNEGQYRLLSIDCSMGSLISPGSQHMQYFQPDVTAEDAMTLVQLVMLQPAITRDPFLPLNLTETKQQINY